jgi:hypothetical protein
MGAEKKITKKSSSNNYAKKLQQIKKLGRWSRAPSHTGGRLIKMDIFFD